MPPTSTAPKPEINNVQWFKLKTFIMNRRNEETKEQEKEIELSRKRKLLDEDYETTKIELEKIQKEIAEKTDLLKQYADEKHDLFEQLRKVIVDDENRKRVIVDDENRKRFENEKNEQNAIIMNTLNHSPATQIYISQPPVLTTSIPVPSGSSIYKLPLPAGATLTPQQASMKRTRSPSPSPSTIQSLAAQHQAAVQIHQNYQSYKPTAVGNPTSALYQVSQAQAKLNEEQQKHLLSQQLSQQQQQQRQTVQNRTNSSGSSVSVSSSTAAALQQQQQQHAQDFLHRNLLWQQQQDLRERSSTVTSKSSAGSTTSFQPAYFPQQLPPGGGQYQQREVPKSTALYLHQQHPPSSSSRPSYDDTKHRIEHFAIRLPGNPVSATITSTSSTHAPPKGGITAGYPIRGMAPVSQPSHTVYVSQQGHTRLVYTQPHTQQTRHVQAPHPQQMHTIQRYAQHRE